MKSEKKPAKAVAVADPTAAPAEGRGPRVSAIDRALQVLDHLYETGAPAGPYAIARAIGAPLSTVYVIVDDLVEKAVLSRYNDGAVWLGSRLHLYGLAYARSLDFLESAKREMDALCRETGETVQVCGRDGDYMVVLATAPGQGHFRISTNVGTRVPLNWAASGRLLVGHLPEVERIELFRRGGKASPTGRAETDPAVLARASAAAFEERLSVQIGESDFSVACVASPVRDVNGACIATISIVLPEHKVSADTARYADAVKAAAERIEAMLGFQGGTKAA
jgi:DNA-binding IclR family transcriptional regulator